MRFAIPLTLAGLALGVSAGPVEKRAGDLQVFLGIFSSIQDQTDALDNTIKAYTGGEGADVQSASDKLVSIIADGVTAANGQEELSFSDGISLTNPVLALVDHIKAAISDIVDKKDLFVENCLGPTVLASLEAQYSGAQDLAKAVTAKVPADLQEVAAQLAAQISDAIQTGVTAYQGVEGCTTTTAPPTGTEPPTSTATEPPTTSEPGNGGYPTSSPPYPTSTEEPTSSDDSGDCGTSTGYPSSVPTSDVYPTSSPGGEQPTTYPGGEQPTTYPGGEQPTSYPGGEQPTSYPGGEQPTTYPGGAQPTNTYSGGGQPTTYPGAEQPTTTGGSLPVTAGAAINGLTVPGGVLALLAVFAM